MKNVYLSQMSLELPDSKYYYFPYSVGVVWSYATTDPIIQDNYQLKGLFFLKEDIDTIVESMEDPAVLGLSSYIWNTNYNEEFARKTKARWPECKIIVGGANSPNKETTYFQDTLMLTTLYIRKARLVLLDYSKVL